MGSASRTPLCSCTSPGLAWNTRWKKGPKIPSLGTALSMLQQHISVAIISEKEHSKKKTRIFGGGFKITFPVSNGLFFSTLVYWMGCPRFWSLHFLWKFKKIIDRVKADLNLQKESLVPSMFIGRRFRPSTSTMVTTELHIWLFSLLLTSDSLLFLWKYWNRNHVALGCWLQGFDMALAY